MPPNKRDMGMVFQAYSLFPNMDVRTNVAFGLRMRGQDKATRLKSADELLELVGLSENADRYPHQLSGGQQQRVAIARALAIEPKVLLLDEPLSALDARVRAQLRAEIRNLQQRLGITTLFVTHDQSEALSMADRVGVMKAGRLEQLDTPENMYRRPATAFAAEFVGAMNRLPGRVGDSGDVEVLGQRLMPSTRTGASQVMQWRRYCDLSPSPSCPTPLGRARSLSARSWVHQCGSRSHSTAARRCWSRPPATTWASRSALAWESGSWRTPCRLRILAPPWNLTQYRPSPNKP